MRDAQARRDEFRAAVLRSRSAATPGTHALDIVAAVRAVLTDDTVLIIDGGNIGQWCHQALCDRYPGHWVTSGAGGVIGHGVPAAMAARLVYPDRPIIVLSGDGSFTFSAAELESATRQGLPFVVIVADDQAWGITLTGQLRQFGRSTTAELGPIRFDLLAQSLGAHGVRVDRAEDLVPALRGGLSADRPTLIHVPVVRSNPADP
jgi:acetolactate synthase I/II/III large subunit